MQASGVASVETLDLVRLRAGGADRTVRRGRRAGGPGTLLGPKGRVGGDARRRCPEDGLRLRVASPGGLGAGRRRPAAQPEGAALRPVRGSVRAVGQVLSGQRPEAAHRSNGAGDGLGAASSRAVARRGPPGVRTGQARRAVGHRTSRAVVDALDQRGVRSARNAAGLPAELDQHCLRHSYITHLVEFDYAEKFVQDQAGHAFASTTGLYTAVSDDYRNRALARALRRYPELWDEPGEKGRP